MTEPKVSRNLGVGICALQLQSASTSRLVLLPPFGNQTFFGDWMVERTILAGPSTVGEWYCIYNGNVAQAVFPGTWETR